MLLPNCVSDLLVSTFPMGHTRDMTKKDFEAIAAIFNRQVTNPTINCLSDAMVALYSNAAMHADYFASVNPRFDRARFMKACGF